MKARVRFVLSVLGIFAWLVGTNAFTPVVHAAPANTSAAVSVSASGKDTDHDGLTDAQEKACGTNPKVADTNHNGIRDGADDQDHDGVSNSAEFQNGTGCRSKDTDHDGISDGQELSHGTNPLKKDSDGDGVPDKSDNHPEDSSHH